MKTIKEDDSICIEMYPEIELLSVKWYANSQYASEEYFKNINLLYLDIFSTNKISKFLLDTVHFAFIITPEIQVWVAQNILSKLADLGIQKIAFLTSQDFVAQLAIEQTMEEIWFNFKVKYFDNREQALAWLDV